MSLGHITFREQPPALTLATKNEKGLSRMKRCLTLLFSLLLTPAFAEESLDENVPARPHQSLTLNLVETFVGGLGLQYEAPLSPYLRLTVPVEIKAKALSLLPQRTLSVLPAFAYGFLPDFGIASGVGLKALYHGWYVQPSALVGYTRIVYPIPNGVRHLASFEPRVLLGYQKVMPFGLVVDLGLGVGYRFFVPEADAAAFWNPIFRIDVGYAW